MRRLLAMVALLSWTAVVGGDDGVGRAYLGVQLERVEPLLRKHLRLDEQEGLLVRNVLVDGAAARAGIERDDILLRLDGEAVGVYEELVARLQTYVPGDQVTLEIMRAGQLRQLTARLQAAGGKGVRVWEYPQTRDSGRIIAGRTFRRFGDQGPWREVPLEEIQQLDAGLAAALARSHGHDAVLFGQVAVNGDTKAPETTVTVTIAGQRYQAAVDALDAIPQGLRSEVTRVLQRAQAAGQAGVYDIYVPVVGYGDERRAGETEEAIRLRQELAAVRERLEALEQRLEDEER